MSPWRCRAAFGDPPLPDVYSIKAGSRDEVSAGASISLAKAIQSFQIAQGTPWVSRCPSVTTTIGICGRSLEEGKRPQALRNARLPPAVRYFQGKQCSPLAARKDSPEPRRRQFWQRQKKKR